MDKKRRERDEQIRACYGMLFRTALRLTGNEHDAVDLTQDALCRALAGWGRFRGQARRSTWMHGILVNCVRDWRRRGGEAQAAFDLWETLAVPGCPDAVLNSLQAAEHARVLRRIIHDELPEALRAAFILTALDGLTYREAAEILGVPSGTIASRVSHARRRVGQAMREAFPDRGA